MVTGNGRIPNLARNIAGNFHVVYGIGGSVVYAASVDKEQIFSSPAVISVFPQVVASSMCGRSLQQQVID